jgi:hypothetical protein
MYAVRYCQNTFTSVSVSVWVQVIMVLNTGGIYVMLMLSEIIEFCIMKFQSLLCIGFCIPQLLFCVCTVIHVTCLCLSSSLRDENYFHVCVTLSTASLFWISVSFYK